MISNIFVFTEDGEHINKQFEALKIISEIMRDGNGTIIQYNLEQDLDGLTLDSLSKPISSRYYFDYTSYSLEELDNEIIERYKLYKENFNDDEKYHPCVIYVDGGRRMSDYSSFEDLCDFLNERLNLIHFLNLYIIIIL